MNEGGGEFVNSKLLKLISHLDLNGLLTIPVEHIRPILPFVVRGALCEGLDTSEEWEGQKLKLLQLCNRSTYSNDVLQNLTVDFGVLQEDAVKLRDEQKKEMAATGSADSLLKMAAYTIAVYEQSNVEDRYRMLIREMVTLINLCELNDSRIASRFNSQLFSSVVYLHTVTDMLCYLCAELPSGFHLLDICHAMLYVPNGNKTICKLVTNNFEAFHSVCIHLFHILESDKCKDDGAKGESLERRVESALLAMCDINRDEAATIRALCVQHCQMASLAVTLSLDYINASNDKCQTDEMMTDMKTTSMLPVNSLVLFVTGLLMSNDDQTKSWFSSYLKKESASNDSRLFKHLSQELRSVVKSGEFHADLQSPTKPTLQQQQQQRDVETKMHCLLDSQCVRAAGLIRMYCALKAKVGIIFTHDDSNYLLLLITCFPPRSIAGARFLSLALGMLLVCPGLLTTPVEEKRVRDWIAWLAGVSLEMTETSSSSFAEQLLLTAIHLLEDRKQDAVRLACSTLGMKINVDPNQFARIKNIFTKDVFPPQKVAEHAIKVPITKDINANMEGYLPVHCVYQLLKTRAFSQGKIHVKTWIYKQICSTKVPLHPHLQPLIQEYVGTLVNPPTTRQHGFRLDHLLNTPFTEDEILRVFGKKKDAKISYDFHHTDDEFSLTTKLLMLYYTLLYEEKVLNNMKELALQPNRPRRYSSSLMNKIPVKLLLHKAQGEPRASQGLYPALIGLLINHLPHLCMVSDWLEELDDNMSTTTISSSSTRNKQTSTPTPEQLYNDLRCSALIPAPAIIHLRELSSPHITEADDVIKHVKAFTWALPHLLDNKVPRRVRKEALKLWFRLNSLVPRKLWVLTVSSLLPSSEAWKAKSLPPRGHQLAIDFEMLVTDPLIVLSVDRKALQCPEFLEMILRMLPACISANKSHTISMLKANPTLVKGQKSSLQWFKGRQGEQQSVEIEKEKLRKAYTATLQSAAVQMLIEICGMKFDDHESSNKLFLLTSRREVQCLACSAIHQFFINDKDTAKLVSIQGYAPELIEILVAGVPSAHICTEFVSDLLQYPDYKKQIFAIELASQLCLHYRLERQMSVAKLCINTMSSLVTVVPKTEFCEFFNPTLSSLPNFTSAFPPLLRDVISLLSHISRVINAFVTSQHEHTTVMMDEREWNVDIDDDVMIAMQSNDDVISSDRFVCLYAKVRRIYSKIVHQNVPETSL